MLERLKQQVSPYVKARHWYVAYSGGLDSHVLLHSLSALAKQSSEYPPVIAVHINHQIQSCANAWELHCQQQAELLGVEYISFRVDVDKARNVEEHARKARYEAFSRLLGEGDCIFFGHHQQDQVETFFYRLFRGTGLKGLLGMSVERALGKGRLLRPFLNVERTALEIYASLHQLDFINDPSNVDVGYDRNYIRHELLPVMQRRWPAFKGTVQRVISHLQQANELLDELAIVDLKKFEAQGGVQPSLSLQPLSNYTLNRQKNLLRYWLARHNVVLSSQQTDELLNAVIHASEDANPVLNIGIMALHRYRQRLYIVGRQQLINTIITWNGLSTCYVNGYGGLALSSPLDIDLTVRPREGGEKIKPVDSAHTRKLKTLLQEMGIPPWQRDVLPLIYCGEDLIAVANLVTSTDAEQYLQGRVIVVSAQES